jgi:hypothetical protein
VLHLDAGRADLGLDLETWQGRRLAAVPTDRARDSLASITAAISADAAFMISAIGSAMSGMASAIDRFDRASARIAQPEPADPVHDRVEQISAQRTFEANLVTVRTADDMIGSLLDIFA